MQMTNITQHQVISPPPYSQLQLMEEIVGSHHYLAFDENPL